MRRRIWLLLTSHFSSTLLYEGRLFFVFFILNDMMVSAPVFPNLWNETQIRQYLSNVCYWVFSITWCYSCFRVATTWVSSVSFFSNNVKLDWLSWFMPLCVCVCVCLTRDHLPLDYYYYCFCHLPGGRYSLTQTKPVVLWFTLNKLSIQCATQLVVLCQEIYSLYLFHTAWLGSGRGRPLQDFCPGGMLEKQFQSVSKPRFISTEQNKVATQEMIHPTR